MGSTAAGDGRGDGEGPHCVRDGCAASRAGDQPSFEHALGHSATVSTSHVPACANFSANYKRTVHATMLGKHGEALLACAGEDVGHYGGSYKVTYDLYKKFGELRLLDTPICGARFEPRAPRGAACAPHVRLEPSRLPTMHGLRASGQRPRLWT